MNPGRVQVKSIVRQRRKELGMTVDDFARAVGVRSSEFIALIEAGHKVIGLDRAPAFAAVLQLDVMGFCLCCLSESYPIFHRAVFGDEEPSPPFPR